MTQASAVPLTRAAASEAVTGIGWRLVLGFLRTTVRTGGLRQAAETAAAIAAEAGPVAEDRLLADVRGAELILTVRDPSGAMPSGTETDLVKRISEILAGRGLKPGVTGGSVQVMEIAIDALDISRILPFWRAALGYVDEPSSDGQPRAIVDPAGQGAAVWFQQMTEPRPQRNRIHLDISVPHDQARQRIEAAIAAGGVLVSDAEAPAFWVLADAEGNEACITTWQGRD
ncbi:MAG: 4a-hydroxytetrahydrobiopterin dehydratase [Nocardiopsaceae bacterium]|jgi:4a-hydroxytetrahydrobiopterin dehydratase|nr:4a-hydroxytetrahydrobiopterin dehydratase [Nocardiopsaceae bacterium]